jgi:hypothetical protein
MAWRVEEDGEGHDAPLARCEARRATVDEAELHALRGGGCVTSVRVETYGSDRDGAF